MDNMTSSAKPEVHNGCPEDIRYVLPVSQCPAASVLRLQAASRLLVMLFLCNVVCGTVPRLWFSRRWRLAVLSCVALFITTSQRLSLDVALVAMLNQTTSSTDDNLSSPAVSRRADNVINNASDDDVPPRHSIVSCFNATDDHVLTTNIFQYRVRQAVNDSRT